MISRSKLPRGLVLVFMTCAISALSFGVNWTSPPRPLSDCEKPAFSHEGINCEGIGASANQTFLLFNNRLNLNYATYQELLLIPKLNRKTASEILAHRERVGHFSSYDQVDSIKGVGPKTLESLKKHTRLVN